MLTAAQLANLHSAEDLNEMATATPLPDGRLPGAGDDKPSSITLRPACHPTRPVEATYLTAGVLRLTCAECHATVIEITVGGRLTGENIRDAVLAFTGAHEQGTPAEPACTTSGEPGTPCWTNRCYFIGYLCHSLGVRGSTLMTAVAESVAEYDARCKDLTCQHGEN